MSTQPRQTEPGAIVVRWDRLLAALAALAALGLLVWGLDATVADGRHLLALGLLALTHGLLVAPHGGGDR